MRSNLDSLRMTCRFHFNFSLKKWVWLVSSGTGHWTEAVSKKNNLPNICKNHFPTNHNIQWNSRTLLRNMRRKYHCKIIGISEWNIKRCPTGFINARLETNSIFCQWWRGHYRRSVDEPLHGFRPNTCISDDSNRCYSRFNRILVQ